MTRRAWIAALLILTLGGLNFYRYWTGPTLPNSEEPLRSTSLAPTTLPDLHAPGLRAERANGTPRDLFVFVKAPPQPTAPTLLQPVPPKAPQSPDPREVALETARINLRNIRITGILSSKSGLSAMVNAPFFNGTALAGTDLGEGLRLEVVSLTEVRISHPELDLVRDIVVE
ncbi:hypothetical protein K3X13_15450 (plasmid) [Aliiroseovarius crassostreae]|uniref:hypothetical protein n=1 Tax=Aliiroseovarius crassostreae TaxID=154981 RepID=UPI002209B7FF|nr:hypothetical protein [Aliiroseovarius crassostreae]UWP94072.1 hypothetical protein K3X13_15450 [Aliiroseovarius crassostreae]